MALLVSIYVEGSVFVNVQQRGDRSVRWVTAKMKDVLIDVRAVSERVRAYGQAENAQEISGAVATRLAVVAAELESALRNQLVLDSLGARRISGKPAGEHTDTPGYEWIDLDLPVAPSFLIYPEPSPSDRAQVLGTAADVLANVVAVMGDVASGQVATAAVRELESIQAEIREYANSLVDR